MERAHRTVLIVDDNAEVRRQLCEEFIRHDFHICAEAENGQEAIDKARKYHPELIILDLSMPVMNGLDAAPHLKKIVPDCPIILYTLFAGSVSKFDLDRRGVTLALSKDEPIEALIDKAEQFFQV